MRPNVRKPPACVAGGGYYAAQLLLDECQVSHPARKPETGLEPVIRMASETGGIAWGERMSLKAVDQSGREGVKVQVWTSGFWIGGVLKPIRRCARTCQPSYRFDAIPLG